MGMTFVFRWKYVHHCQMFSKSGFIQNQRYSCESGKGSAAVSLIHTDTQTHVRTGTHTGAGKGKAPFLPGSESCSCDLVEMREEACLTSPSVSLLGL